MAIDNSSFAKYISKKVDALSQINATKTGSLNFGSLSQVSQYTSIFDQAGNDISKINYDNMLKAFEDGTVDGLEDENSKSMASVLNELMSIDGVSDKIDISGDGTVDATELEAFVKDIANADGDAKNLTFEDIDKFIEQMGIDLSHAAEDAVLDALNDIDEDEKELTQANEASQSSGGTSGASGASGSSGANRTQQTSQANKTPKEPETAEEIKTEIQNKQKEISDIEADAEKQIQEQQKAKQDAMKEAGVSEKQLQEYEKKEQELDGKISKKENEIQNKDKDISDKESTISSNNSYLSSIEQQIASNESKKASLDGKEQSSEIADIESKNSNLKAEKEKIEKENQKAEKEIAKAKEEKTKLEQEKTNLENQKQQLLEKTLGADGVGNDAKAEAAKQKARDAENKIAQIKSDKNSKVSEINGEIKTLETKLQNVEAAEQRKTFLNENKAKTGGLGLTGEELADIAKNVGGAEGTVGWCLRGVNDTLEEAYGFRLSYNSAYQALGEMQNKDGFEDVTSDYNSPQDLANLPAGAMVIWDKGNGHEHGHISIALGDGTEASDHIQKQITGFGTKYHVFMPAT